MVPKNNTIKKQLFSTTIRNDKKLFLQNKIMPTVVELIKERFSDLTEIQKIAIPKILNGENVLILAPVGSGKSEAAWLPILEKIKDKKDGIRALYISPLRSLGRDQYARFKWWCDKLNVNHAVRTGDTTQAERTKHRKNAPQILLTTPESLQALLLGRIMRQHLANVEFVIIDEVHDILDNKRGVQLSFGLERLAEITKINFQRIAISATVANEEEAAHLIFGNRSYAIAEVGKGRKMQIEVENIVNHEKRIEKIKEISEKHRALIFVNTRSTAEELGASLKRINAPIEVHHGSLSKEVRIAAEDKFKSGEIRSLLATSSLELGIDIGDVDIVIQYGSPHQAFRLIQRVGRSGHSLEKTPKGIVFATDFDDFLEAEMIKLLAENFWLENKHVEKGALDVIAHQLIGLCFDKGGLDLKQAHEILSRSYAYGISFNKLRKIALQLYSEGIIFYNEDLLDKENVRINGTARAREYYYSNLSTIPKEKRYALRNISSNSIMASLDEEFVSNLDIGVSFLSRGQPWIVIDITDKEVLVDPSSATDIAVPEWTGEDIPVSFEVAQGLGKLRKVYKKELSPLPDDKNIVVEIIGDIVILHSCFGSRINESFARILSFNISKLIGETVRAVSDPYRILIKLPFVLDKKHIATALGNIKDVRKQLELSLENSFLLKFKFLHVARLFGLLSEEATVGQRFIDAMRNSVVYEEAMRAIFSRYFDVNGLEKILDKIEEKEIEIIFDERKELSYFGKLGVERVSANESIGSFEPREAMINALKERVMNKTIELKCVNCNATRFLHIAGHINEKNKKLTCHKCQSQALTILEKRNESQEDLETKAALIRNYGFNAIIALVTYGVGNRTAERVLKKLHRNEEEFYWDLLQAQKTFIKTKRYWQIGR